MQRWWPPLDAVGLQVGAPQLLGQRDATGSITLTQKSSRRSNWISRDRPSRAVGGRPGSLPPAVILGGQPAAELGGYRFGVVGEETGLTLADQAGGDAVFQTDAEDRAEHAEIFEQLGRDVALLTRVVPLQEQQHIGTALDFKRLLVGNGGVDRHPIAHPRLFSRRQDKAGIAAIELDPDTLPFGAKQGQRLEQGGRVAAAGIKNAGIGDGQVR